MKHIINWQLKMTWNYIEFISTEDKTVIDIRARVHNDKVQQTI